MFKVKYLAAPAMLALILAACGGTAASSAAPESEAAVPSAAARVVAIEIGDGVITPASVTVQQGETITFEVTNANTVEVELIVGLKAEVDADSGDSLKEVYIAPGATGSVTYTFDGAGPFGYGDQKEDHYAKGAKGDIVLEP